MGRSGFLIASACLMAQGVEAALAALAPTSTPRKTEVAIAGDAFRMNGGPLVKRVGFAIVMQRASKRNGEVAVISLPIAPGLGPED